MGVSRILVPLIAITYIICDLVITSLSYGFYNATWSFNLTRIKEYALLQDGYSWMDSPFDFAGMALLRATLVGFGLVCFGNKCVLNWNVGVISMNFVSWSYCLVKILALSERTECHTYPGLYISIGWNMLSNLFLTVFWCLYLHTKTTPTWLRVCHKYLRNIVTIGNKSQSEPLIEEEDIEEAADLEEKLTTLSHVIKIVVYCKHHINWFCGGFFFLTIYSTARIFIPYITGTVLANIVKGGSKDAAYDSLVNSVILMACLTMLATSFSGLRGGTFLYATSLIHKRMRNDLFRSLTKQEIGFFDEAETGAISSRLTSDCEKMSSLISTNLNVFMRNSVMLCGAMAFMFAMSWRLALVTLIVVPLLGFISKIFGTYYDILGERTQLTIADANKKADEVLSTMRTIRSFAAEKGEADKFEEYLGKTLDVRKKESLAYMAYTWLNEFCDNAILVTVLFYGGHLVISNRMTSDQLLKFLLYQIQLGENMLQISWVFSGLMQSVGASRKVFEYILREPKIKYDGTLTPDIKGKIEFKNVQLSYPTRPNQVVLKNVSFTVHPGETVALVGPSGAGKSSIVSLLERFYTAQSGEILIDDIKIEDIQHKWLHNRVSLVAQNPILYSGTVRDNILYACEWATTDDMLKASKMANCHDFIMAKDNNYDAMCGEKGCMWSGGQIQRISISRSMTRDPKILLLDESTSALDGESEAIVQEALEKSSDGRTTIIIAHRLSTIEKADRILVFDNGEIVQSGTHSSLMEDEGMYRNLVNRQLKATVGDNSPPQKKSKARKIRNASVDSKSSVGVTGTSLNVGSLM
uniref:ATP-binding cassette sub-family B member 9 n=1 Tax=Rhabditophanes sp. KR3021 TaxID=114890 RepID=A0AC35UD14_9BILA